MKGNPEERAVALGQFVVETGATVRSAAQKFGISKSTVHKDITARLERQNRALYREVQRVLRTNKEGTPPARRNGHAAQISPGGIKYHLHAGATQTGKRLALGCPTHHAASPLW